MVFHLDLTGKTGTTFAFNAKDLDGSTDNSVQPIALQYRVGNVGRLHQHSGGLRRRRHHGGQPGHAGHSCVGPVAGSGGQPGGRLRPGHDDERSQQQRAGRHRQRLHDQRSRRPHARGPGQPRPADQHSGVAISTLQLDATGGTAPLTYGATGLPPGLTLNTSNGADHRHPDHARRQPLRRHRHGDRQRGRRRPGQRELHLDRQPAPQRDGDQGHPGHRGHLADDRPGRRHRGCGDRGVPDRRLQRLLHPDPGAGHRQRVRRDLRLRRCGRLRVVPRDR